MHHLQEGFMQQLSDQIKIARLSAGLTQAQLGEKIGVTKQAITWWETGVHHPRLPVLKQMEDVLKARFNVTGNKGLPSFGGGGDGIKAEYMALAIEISRLPKASRESITQLVKALQVLPVTK